MLKKATSLFSNDININFSDTFLGKMLERIYFPYATELFLGIATFILWYEGFLEKYIFNIGSGVITFLLIVLAFLFTDKKNIIIKKAHLWYISFLTLGLISSIVALYQGINGKLLLSGWLIFAQFGIAFFAGEGIKEKKKILRYLIYLSVPLSVVGSYQFLTRLNTPTTWLSPLENSLTRSFAFFGSPNILGATLTIVAILSLSFYFKEKKIQYLAISLFHMLVIIFTFSRSAWLGLFLGLVFLIYFYRPKILTYSPIILVFLFFNQVRDRLKIVFTREYYFDSYLDGRIWSYINGIHIWKKYPIFGSGPGTYGGKLALENASPIYLESIQRGYTALYYTDNQYLEIIVQTGLLGLLTFLGFLVSLFLLIMRKYFKKEDIMLIGSVAVFISFLVIGMFENILEFGAVSVPVAIILGVSINES